MTATEGEGARATEAPRAREVGVGRVRVPRASEVVAELLRESILGRDIAAGSLLPPERELAKEMGVGRASIREALKTLALEGLLSTRLGRNGGYVVQLPAPDAVINSLDVFIKGRRLHSRSLEEIREIVEPACAALAAGRRSAEQLAELTALTSRMRDLTEDSTTFQDLNLEWHLLVAAASGNEILAALMTAISTNIRAATGVEEYDSPAMLRAAQRIHESVLRAIADQDAASARRRMAKHLQETSEVVTRGMAEST